MNHISCRGTVNLEPGRLEVAARQTFALQPFGHPTAGVPVRVASPLGEG
ncbi:MAG: hypothetical protein HWQ38_31705 [Nostoc sp. NMS7]|nr:hypothetical protein [Nostoc sp. NMS7]